MAHEKWTVLYLSVSLREGSASHKQRVESKRVLRRLKEEIRAVEQDLTQALEDTKMRDRSLKRRLITDGLVMGHEKDKKSRKLSKEQRETAKKGLETLTIFSKDMPPMIDIEFPEEIAVA